MKLDVNALRYLSRDDFSLIVRLAEHGLIHCDFNEFNIMIDDDEKVTMIDFPQMVSVSHRNAQMYFDRDVECIFKFFRKRFKLTFELQSDEADGKDANVDEDNSRPSFSSILPISGSLDRELAASGFSKKDQESLEKFIEGTSKDLGSDDDANTDDESSVDEDDVPNDTDIKKFESLSLIKQDSREQECDAEIDSEQISSTASKSSEVQSASDEEKSDEESDAKLAKCLGKQRRRAIASAHRRQNLTSRNSYKDKGGKSSQNSKIQKQFGGW